MADSILRDKSKAFAKDIVFLCRQLRESRVEGVLINQLLTSARNPLETKGFRALYVLMKMLLQHFCNTPFMH